MPCFLVAALHAQRDTAVLETSGVRAVINADGTWGQSSLPALSLSSGNKQVPILNKLSVWVSGRSGTGILVGSFSDVFSDSSNFLPGPLGLSGGAAANPVTWNKVYTAHQSQITQHRKSFRDQDYRVPDLLTEWPANGPQGFDAVLAPFADFDRNGKYNPEQGDYPFVAGTSCAYTISNDFSRGDWKQTTTPGIEIQQLVRTFTEADQQIPAYLIRYTLHNRSVQDYRGMRLSLAADFAIGSTADDYLATDVGHNALIAYNGSDSDAFFGKSAPACALMFLNRPIGGTMYFESGNDAVKGKPLKALDYYNLARACWKTGKPLAFGNAGLDGKNVSSYIYSNGTDPAFKDKWNEWEAANFPGRRTGLISTDSFDLPAGSSLIIEASVGILPAVGNKLDLCPALLELQK
ncbi:MAG: hypothetical protein KJS92_03200, partial [Bacteroidetes bacterium]|nr:hypothetical protein [Bacteroidota bacterium]